MGMGAVEVNNGTIDHDRWSGPVEGMSAALGSLERGPWSGMAYGVTRFNAEDSSGSKDGNTLFVNLYGRGNERTTQPYRGPVQIPVGPEKYERAATVAIWGPWSSGPL